jgi:translation initiation factor 3 subunit F
MCCGNFFPLVLSKFHFKKLFSSQVTECFAEPFSESIEERRISIYSDYHRSMYNFHRRNNKKEVMVGWYTTTLPTGEFINDNSSLIHDVFAKEIENPIHIVVDTTLLNDGIHIRGFVGKPTMIGDEVLANSFNEIKVDIDFTDHESTLLYHMIHSQCDTTTGQVVSSKENRWKNAEMVSALPNHMDNVEKAMYKLSETLDKIQNFVDNVVEGKMTGSGSYHEIGIQLTNILNNYSGNGFSAAEVALLNNRFEDLLMVSYLSTLTETQTAIAEKLNQIL